LEDEMNKPVKMAGKEFREFWDCPTVWGDPGDDQGYYDDAHITISGRELGFEVSQATCPDDAPVTIYAASMEGGPNDGKDMADVARKWLKRRDIVTLLVDVPRAKLEAVRAAVKVAGGKA
jgi:hypothetical protein